MGITDDVGGHLVYKQRVNSVTKDLIDDIRDKSAVEAGVGLLQRFGHNNRTLVRGFTK